jgi:hypothetical protein
MTGAGLSFNRLVVTTQACHDRKTTKLAPDPSSGVAVLVQTPSGTNPLLAASFGAPTSAFKGRLTAARTVSPTERFEPLKIVGHRGGGRDRAAQ